MCEGKMRNLKNRLLGAFLTLLVLFSPGVEDKTAPASATEGAMDAIEGVEAASYGVTIKSRLWELLGEKSDEASAIERTYLIPGGVVFGTRLREAHMTVTDPAECRGLMAGDKIIMVDGQRVSRAKDISEALKDCHGETVDILCERGGKRITISVLPKEVSGEYKLGAVLREGAAGIGTVTYIDPETGEFGGLGHGICDATSTTPIEMTGGIVTDVILGAVEKGEVGKPGELCGILTDRTRGVIYSNTDVGVFGKFTELPRKLDTPLPIAYKGEVKRGEATIISTLKNGKRMEYKIEIYDIDTASATSKSFKIRVTDPTLLAISGGIVRGMSGSPIIQDGKLVGAVTHVLINDPTSGYGIFIENMLSEAKQNALPKAA